MKNHPPMQSRFRGPHFEINFSICYSLFPHVSGTFSRQACHIYRPGRSRQCTWAKASMQDLYRIKRTYCTKIPLTFKTEITRLLRLFRTPLDLQTDPAGYSVQYAYLPNNPFQWSTEFHPDCQTVPWISWSFQEYRC